MSRSWRWLPLVVAVALGISFGPARAEAPAANPVIIVHGWHGDDDDRLEGSSFAALASRLERDGHPVYWATGIAVRPGDTMFEGADRLASLVEQVSSRHGGAAVTILAHSYGGLVARAYLESPRFVRSLALGARVANLVTLGAPMGGVDFWMPMLFVLGDPFGEPSVWELTPAFMTQFNRAHHAPAGVRYTLVVGDARRQTPLLWLLPAGDGVVTVASAHALAADGRWLREVLTSDLHTFNALTQAMGLHSYLDYPSTYAEVIAGAVSAGPALAQAPDWPTAAGDVALGDVAGDRSSPTAIASATSTFTHAPVRVERLAPGERVLLDAGASGADAVFLGAEAGIEVRREACLAGATGGCAPTEGEPSTADGGAGPSAPVVIGMPGVPGTAEWAGVYAATPGAPALSITNRGDRPARLATMGLTSPELGALQLGASASPRGLSVSLSATRSPLRHARAEVWTPRGWRTVVLRDDGANPDDVDGDGRFGGALPGATLPAFVRATARLGAHELQTEVALVPITMAVERPTR